MQSSMNTLVYSSSNAHPIVMREGTSGADLNFPFLRHNTLEAIDFMAMFSLEQKKE